MTVKTVQDEPDMLPSERRSSVFFSEAFRPFFLCAGIYAALALLAWLAWIGIHAAGAMATVMTIAEPPHLWHAHEMVFGFAGAAVAGFLLTAVPNWTGARPTGRTGIVILFALWLGGRAAMWFTAWLPAWVPAIADLVFLPALAFVAWRLLAVRPSMRNTVFLGVLGVLILANLAFHFGRLEWLDDGLSLGVRAGLGALVIMISVIGGRITPAFTENALHRAGTLGRPIHSRPIFDMPALALTVVALVLLVADAGDLPTGIAALAAALASGVRLARWRGLKTLGDPLLWVLHVGYGWVVVGFLLLAATRLGGWASDVAALHAFGTGAAGSMILGVMSRASLGHTGRALSAQRSIAVAYVLVSLTAILRCFGPTLMPEFYNEIMLASGIAWIAAFTIFSAVYAPILTGPRL